MCTTASIVRDSFSSSIPRAASQIHDLLPPSQQASAEVTGDRWDTSLHLSNSWYLRPTQEIPLLPPHISNSETSSQEDSVIEAAWVSVSRPTPLGLLFVVLHRPHLIGDIRADNRTVGLPWPFPVSTVLLACPTLTVISPVWPTWGS